VTGSNDRKYNTTVSDEPKPMMINLQINVRAVVSRDVSGY